MRADMLTTDEKLAVLAKAILEIANKVATEHDFDGEQSVTTGLILDLQREVELIARPAS